MTLLGSPLYSTPACYIQQGHVRSVFHDLIDGTQESLHTLAIFWYLHGVKLVKCAVCDGDTTVSDAETQDIHLCCTNV